MLSDYFSVPNVLFSCRIGECEIEGSVIKLVLSKLSFDFSNSD